MVNFKQIILSLTLLVFLGQSFVAAANPCLQITQMPDGAMQIPMDHATHSSADNVPASDMSHCDMQDCGYDLGGCSSAMLPSAQIEVVPILDLAENSYRNSLQPQIANPLLRPPILG